MLLYHSFHWKLYFFQKIIFQFLDIVDLCPCHAFSWLSMKIIRGFVDTLKHGGIVTKMFIIFLLFQVVNLFHL